MYEADVELDNCLEDLNTAQYQAVTSQAKRLLILAGAGSGKTRVLVQRVAWLMTQGISAHRILAVTFTNKAAVQMRKRIEQAVGTSLTQMWVGTFHGLSHRILRQYYEQANLTANFQIIDSDDQLRLVKKLILDHGWNEEICCPKRTVSFINRHKDEGKRASHVAQTGFQDTVMFTEIYRLYEQHCQQKGMIDFAEILLRTYELLKNNPEILHYYQQRFSHIMVDEFQDTNAIQYAWLKLMGGQENQMMIVGDDDQSIYGWRGAKIENIHRFHQDYPDVVMVRLEQNYRSTSTILAAANALIEHNESRLGKELWTQGVQGDTLSLYRAFNEMDEARFIVTQIRQWCQGGGNFDDIAILYRSNAQSRALEQALRQNHIPYRIYGGLRFFDRAEIKDFLAYFRLMANRHDDSAFERVINLPPRGIGDRTLENIRQLAKAQGLSMWSAAKIYLPTITAGRITNGLMQFFDVIEELVEQIASTILPNLARLVLESTGLLQYVKMQPGEKTQGKVENLLELIEATKQFNVNFESLHETQEIHAQQTLIAFLSDVVLDAGDIEASQEVCVKLMTLHAAKGLEFPLVFLTGLEEGLFPHHRSVQEQSLLEEERRLCYVGLTRAMRKCYLSYAEKRSFAGLSGMNRPSRFIQEIPARLVRPVTFESPYNQNYVAKATKPFDVSQSTSRHPYVIGQRVRHARFQEGTIVNTEGEGESARVHVNFDQFGKKWLVVSYAKLEEI